MAIILSKVLEDMPQADGRRAVTELHTDDQGQEFRVSYLAEPDAEPKEMLVIRAAQIEEAEVARKAAIAEQAALDKAQAVAVLKLADAEIAAVMRVSADQVAAVKVELQVVKDK